jgi:uncharacterized damage-inducible protein DinB
METLKEVHLHYLQNAREAVLWKLEGASDYDVRRPLTPTGTNLLGLVKHLAYVELGYFVSSFGRELPVASPFDDEAADPHDDLYATAEESREDIIGLYHLAWAEADRTCAALDLDDEGVVPWWDPPRNRVTLGKLLIHVISETNRHLGQIDILREGIDGAAGLRADVSNMPDDYDWSGYLARLQGTAETFRSRAADPGDRPSPPARRPPRR